MYLTFLLCEGERVFGTVKDVFSSEVELFELAAYI